MENWTKKDKELASQFPELLSRAKRYGRTPSEQLIEENEKAIHQYDESNPYHNGIDPSIDPVTGSKMF